MQVAVPQNVSWAAASAKPSAMIPISWIVPPVPGRRAPFPDLVEGPAVRARENPRHAVRRDTRCCWAGSRIDVAGPGAARGRATRARCFRPYPSSAGHPRPWRRPYRSRHHHRSLRHRQSPPPLRRPTAAGHVVAAGHIAAAGPIAAAGRIGNAGVRGPAPESPLHQQRPRHQSMSCRQHSRRRGPCRSSLLPQCRPSRLLLLLLRRQCPPRRPSRLLLLRRQCLRRRRSRLPRPCRRGLEHPAPLRHPCGKHLRGLRNCLPRFPVHPRKRPRTRHLPSFA